MYGKIVEAVRGKNPLVHNITNYVTVNDCANVLLACGASPIMADDRMEVEAITEICGSLVLNIGTLNQRTIESMILAGKRANAVGHPVVLDPVGAGASKLRTETVFKLLEEVQFAVIRGNISEIKTVDAGVGTTRGVDADVADHIGEDNLAEAAAFAKGLSAKTGAVIAITGAIDLIASADAAYAIRNGHPTMARITGTGCMLSAMLGAYSNSGESLLESVATAVAVMGLSGEKAQEKTAHLGTGSFRVALIDAISTMDGKTLEEGIQIERL